MDAKPILQDFVRDGASYPGVIVDEIANFAGGYRVARGASWAQKYLGNRLQPDWRKLYSKL